MLFNISEKHIHFLTVKYEN